MAKKENQYTNSINPQDLIETGENIELGQDEKIETTPKKTTNNNNKKVLRKFLKFQKGKE